MLNAVNRFFAAALAPVLLNLVLIAAMALAVLKGVPMGDERLLDYVIYAVVLAGLAQFLFVFIAARRAALRVTLSRPVLSDDVEKVWRLAGPGILAAGIGQINLLVGTSIATGWPARRRGSIMPTGSINCPWGLSAWRFPSPLA